MAESMVGAVFSGSDTDLLSGAFGIAKTLVLWALMLPTGVNKVAHC